MIGDEGIAELHARGRLHRFARGAPLIHAGDLGTSVLLLLKGRAKVLTTTADGRQTVLGFRGPGDLVGELSAIDREPRSGTVIALEPVEAVVVGAEEFRRLLSERPSAALALLESLSRRLRDADRKRIEFATADTTGRVAARLLELCDRFGEPAPGGVRITLPLTQEELAGWVGSSREAVANALSTLRGLGWIETGRRQITVLDRPALEARSA